MAKSLERLYGDVSSLIDGLVELSNRYAANLKEQAYGVTSQEISNVDGSGNPLALSTITLENDMKGRILRYSKVVLTFPDGSHPLVIPNDYANQPSVGYENDFNVKIGSIGATVYPGITYPVGSLILSLDYEANTVNAAAGDGSNTGVTGGLCVQYDFGGKLSETSLPSSGGGNGSLKPFTFNPTTGEVEATKFKGDGSGLTNLPAATTPGGSDTQVQFNDGGAFGGTDLITIGTDKVTFTGNVEILGSNEKITLNSGGDIVIDDDVNGGSGSGGLLYRDSGGGLKFAFVVHPSNKVTICNRAANGEVQIRANTSTPGASGELTIATFKDTSVDFLDAAELRGTNIGNIFDTKAYLTAVDFCMSTDRDKSAHSRSDGAASRVDSSLASTFATFQVPLGYQATHVLVSGSSTSSTFDVYESDCDSSSSTSLTSSPSVGTNTALSSASTGGSGKYIVIKFTPGATTRDVYGAKITLARV